MTAEETRIELMSESTRYAYRRYAAQYENFRGHEPHSEDLVLRFLVREAESKAATTLWTAYSLLKKYLFLECDLHLGSSARITDYLKALGRAHKKRKAPAFLREDLFRFLRTAPNEGKDLVRKLVLLAGFYGGMRACEIVALAWQDVAFAQEGVLLRIQFSKTDRAGIGATKLLPRLEDQAICPLFYFEEYRNAVSEKTGRLFRHFAYGKFTKSPVGKNIIAAVPSEVAAFLGLENPRVYTSHSFRVTSATTLADEGANALTLKRHGRWTSDLVAEEYIRESKKQRCETAALLAGSKVSVFQPSDQPQKQPQPAIVFQNCIFNGPIIFKSTDDC